MRARSWLGLGIGLGLGFGIGFGFGFGFGLANRDGVEDLSDGDRDDGHEREGASAAGEGEQLRRARGEQRRDEEGLVA